ncbi:hypothetical protein pb186bvf_011861 [Paramecium bursaria]
MSYETLLWDQIDLLIRDSTQGRNVLDECHEIISQLVIINEQYGKNLEKIGNSMVKYNQHNHLHKLLSILQSQILLDAEQWKANARFMRDHILFQIKELLTQQNHSVRNLFDSSRTLNSQIKQKQQELDKLYSDYKKKQNDYFQWQIQMYSQKNVSDIVVDKKAKQMVKSDEMSRQLYEMEQKMRQSVDNYNQYLEGYHQRMASIMRDLQVQDSERGLLLKQLLQNVVRKESLLQDISNCDIQKYQSDFIEQHKTQNEILKPKEFINPNSYTLESIIDISENKLDMIENRLIEYQKILDQYQFKIEDIKYIQVGEYQLRKLIQEHSEQLKCGMISCIKYIKQIMNEIWSAIHIDLDIFFKVMRNNKIGRYIWVHYLQNFRVQRQLDLNLEAFHIVGQVVNCMLTICSEEYDVYVVRKTVLMSLTFYMVNGTEKLFLQELIKGHEIFKSIELWEIMMFQSLYEEIRSQNSHKLNEQIQDSVEREKNTVFGFLGSLCKNMLIFNIEKPIIKQLVVKYAKFYNLQDVLLKALNQIVDEH